MRIDLVGEFEQRMVIDHRERRGRFASRNDVADMAFVERLVALSDGTSHSMVSEQPTPSPLDAFLSSLQTVWHSGDARPTASDKPRQKRGRRRPDPLIEVTGQLQRAFEDDPRKSGLGVWSCIRNSPAIRHRRATGLNLMVLSRELIGVGRVGTRAKGSFHDDRYDDARRDFRNDRG